MTWEVGAGSRRPLTGPASWPTRCRAEWRDELGLKDRTWSFRTIHAPRVDGVPPDGPTPAGLRRAAPAPTAARAAPAGLRARRSGDPPRPVRTEGGGDLVSRFLARLPFRLTGAQRGPSAEISADLAGPHPMHRLLQGDVGRGKTVVAVASLLVAVQGGHQGALMAPTEVLAEQHAPIRAGAGHGASDGTTCSATPGVEMLTSRVRPATGRLPAGLAGGEVDVLVGTHALLTEAVGFRTWAWSWSTSSTGSGSSNGPCSGKRGGRRRSRRVGDDGHADPADGGHDRVRRSRRHRARRASPAGRRSPPLARGPWPTRRRGTRVRQEVAAGHQAYVVCPLVEESASGSRPARPPRSRSAWPPGSSPGCGSAWSTASCRPRRRRRRWRLPAGGDRGAGGDHGDRGRRGRAQRHRDGDLDADRFGIAQLHQLRGRVGRGRAQSWCYLSGRRRPTGGRERLAAVERTTDGFALAEVDLDLRGEGTILGARQRADRPAAGVLVGCGGPVPPHRGPAGGRGHRQRRSAPRGAPALADEIRLFLREDEREYLFKS